MNQASTAIVDSLASESVADAAIARVIDAEREAHQSIVDAEAEAVAMIERARVAIRALDERTERRVRAVRAAFERRTGAAVAALDREGELVSAGQPLTEADLALVQSAVDALARTLTEGAP
jgi:hypothetical protein